MFGGILLKKLIFNLSFFKLCTKWFAVWVCLAFVGRCWCILLDFLASQFNVVRQTWLTFLPSNRSGKCSLWPFHNGFEMIGECILFRRNPNLVPPTFQIHPFDNYPSALTGICHERHLFQLFFISMSWCL